MQRRNFLTGAASLVTFTACRRGTVATNSEEPSRDPAEPVARVGFGHVCGRFIYDGESPTPPPIELTGSDADLLRDFNIVNESLLVSANNRGLANICIWLDVPSAADDSIRSADDESNLEQPDPPMKLLVARHGRFEPHVLIVQTDEHLKIEAARDDGFAYNPRVIAFVNPGYNRLVPPGGYVDVNFKVAERTPISVVCSIHPWMMAWLVVKDHQYVAVTDAAGRFEIRDVPAGEQGFRFWHERAGFVAHVRRDGKSEAWEKGRATLQIRAGETLDLGDIKVSPELFATDQV